MNENEGVILGFERTDLEAGQTLDDAREHGLPAQQAGDVTDQLGEFRHICKRDNGRHLDSQKPRRILGWVSSFQLMAKALLE